MEQIAGFYFCHCPDMQMAKEYFEDMYLPQFGEAWINAERQTFWLEDIVNNKYFTALDSISFETRNRIYFIRDSHELALEYWKKISAALGKARSDSISVFFVANQLEKGKLKVPVNIQKQKCFEFAQKKGWIYKSVGITDENFAQIIKKEANKKYRLQLSNEVINILKEILSPDYHSLNNILAQLSLFSGKGAVKETGEETDNPENSFAESQGITPAIISQLTNYTPELGIFDLINKIESGNSREVWKFLIKEGRQIEDGFLFLFISLMMREMRMLWKIKAKEQIYLSAYQAATKNAIANKLGFTYISKIISLLCFAEYSVKSGKKPVFETFEELVKDIVKIYQKDFSALKNIYSNK